MGFALLLLLMPAQVRAQPLQNARPGPVELQADRCSEPSGEAGGRLGQLTLSLSDLAPLAQDILAHHGIRATWSGSGRQLRLELHLDGIQNLRLPEGSAATLYLPRGSTPDVMRDRRSRLPQLWRLDDATVVAADMAYDIRLPETDAAGALPVLQTDLGQLPGYRPVKLYGDMFSGFAAVALERLPRGGSAPHRIYAIAGTHVFEHRDFRSWASGLTFGRAQFTSTAALEMIRDAAAYARDMRGGGEVVLTGQSQGGLVAQGVGYMLQAYLDASPAMHHLVQVVSWGGTGAQEVIQRMIAAARETGGRGISPDLERHWAASQVGYGEAAAVWSVLLRQWRGIHPGNEAASIRSTASRMRVLGYFFEIDLFARAGTFLGTAMAFPTEFILPGGCDLTVLETLIGMDGGSFGVRLESHFLKGYRRAVSRGATAVARPALPAKWPWVTDLLPATELVGMAWLKTLYLDGPAATPENWQRCLSAERWLTRDNRFCSESFWPGCMPDPAEARWCLIRDATAAPRSQQLDAPWTAATKPRGRIDTVP
ncbi:hypothetical protein EBE87_05675 [Pseudoroseomonas wenyumeiae]|uniref:DUF2974 domain-containing protein n=1 Tax=Teichococcus wenyumeiae TaxID=2478470 RepID=A0A3A9JH46_9PROT|nr:hypothetical protein D6Z83_01930 [Pseudoroseomonas wenyumeiae]RMI25889.1 hypothetical protein EBE87_05675 [Pseudoroseomonas wenyumeiae]